VTDERTAVALARCRRVARRSERDAVLLVWGGPALLVVIALALAAGDVTGRVPGGVGIVACVAAALLAVPPLRSARWRPPTVPAGRPLEQPGAAALRDAVDRALVRTGQPTPAIVRATFDGRISVRRQDGGTIADIGIAWVDTTPTDVIGTVVVRAVALREAGTGGRGASLLDAEIDRLRISQPFDVAAWWTRRRLAVLERTAARAQARREAAAVAVGAAVAGRDAYDDACGWVAEQEQFAAYCDVDVTPCVDDGFLPPIVEGWRMCLTDRGVVDVRAPRDPSGVRELEREVVAAVVPGAGELVEIDWSRMATAVGLPRLRRWLADWAGDVPAFTVGALGETLRHRRPDDVDPHAWAEVVGATLAVGAVESLAAGLEIRPGRDLLVVGDGWSFAPFRTCEAILEDPDHGGMWAAFARSVGVEDVLLDPSSGAPDDRSAPTDGALRDRPTQVLALAPLRRRRAAAAGLALGGMLGLAGVAMTVAAAVAVDTLLARAVFLAAAVALFAGIAVWIGRRLPEVRESGTISVGGEALRIDHPGVLKRPFVIPRAAVRLVVIDAGEWFPDRRLPVAGTELATAGDAARDETLWLWEAEGPMLVPTLGPGSLIPNLAILVDDPQLAPQMRRVTLEGPMPGEAARGYLLEVAEVDAARAALAPWAVIRPGRTDDVIRLFHRDPGTG
jgi:hypothetical protein